MRYEFIQSQTTKYIALFDDLWIYVTPHYRVTLPCVLNLIRLNSFQWKKKKKEKKKRDAK